MFERYTDRARRVIFFARYDASALASSSIDTEHLLLGLLREGAGIVGKIFKRNKLTYEMAAGADVDVRGHAALAGSEVGTPARQRRG
jgi:ATP-dependent Clp protease ATP-binding subunit ClpA